MTTPHEHKPEDFPEDVWDEAVMAMSRCGHQERDVRIACAQAILDERERCASFHDDMAAEHKRLRRSAQDEFDHTFHAKGYERHTHYAHAIRTPTNGQGE